MATSNLGGHAGPQGNEPITASTPHAMVYHFVANHPTLGFPIHLSITNQTEYQPFRTSQNGIKHSVEGRFGVINVKAPRRDEASGTLPTRTSVRLRFTFLNGLTNEPIDLDSTHFTFYDLDASAASMECLIVHDADEIALPDETDLSDSLVSGGGREFCSSEVGAGADNPTNPSLLTTDQRRRSVMLTLRNRAHFDVTFAISGCCSTGRNFLFSGLGQTSSVLNFS